MASIWREGDFLEPLYEHEVSSFLFAFPGSSCAKCAGVGVKEKYQFWCIEFGMVLASFRLVCWSCHSCALHQD
eukprot:5931348-Amphidinium_carterae.1